jgi:hypothetical protein
MRFERPTLNASVISRSPAPRAWPDIVFRILVILVLATVPCVASALHSEARRAKERVAGTVSRANRMGTPYPLRSLGRVGVARPYQTSDPGRQTRYYAFKPVCTGITKLR